MPDKIATGSAIYQAFEEALTGAEKVLDGTVRRDAGLVVASGGKRRFRVFVEVVEVTNETQKVPKKKEK